MKEKVEKMLKSALKRKLTITTATLISFLLTSNIAMADQVYQVGNNGIKRDNSGTWEEATEKLKNMGLFKIEGSTIENRLKDDSSFELLSEVNKPFINKGSIYKLTNKGRGKIENRGNIEQTLKSETESNIENLGFISNIELSGNIINKAYIGGLDSIDSFNKGIAIENEGSIYGLHENKKVKNYGYIENVFRIADTEKIENYGIISFNYIFNDIADYNTLNEEGKFINKGIVINDLNNFTASGNRDDKGRDIKNYKSEAIADTEITNGILNAYIGTIDKDLTLNNSILNMREGTIEADKKLSFNNSTANIDGVKFKDGIKLEFKDNSNIGDLVLYANSPTDDLKSITIDNTTTVGAIIIKGEVEKSINLVPNGDIANKDKILRINYLETEADKEINTNISSNVDLLGLSQLGNIIVKSGGRLTIGENLLLSNGTDFDTGKLYKKDITIENGGKILIGIDPYNIGEKRLGAGNNLTASVVGQNDPDKTSVRLAQSALNIDADSLLHDIVIEPAYSVNYTDVGPQNVRNKYKIIEQLDLPTPPTPPGPTPPGPTPPGPTPPGPTPPGPTPPGPTPPGPTPPGPTPPGPTPPGPTPPGPTPPGPTPPGPIPPGPTPPGPTPPGPTPPGPTPPGPTPPGPTPPGPTPPGPTPPGPTPPGPTPPGPTPPGPTPPGPTPPGPTPPGPIPPGPTPPGPTPPTGKPVWDYDYLNAVYYSLYEAGKVKEFSVYNKEELDGLYQYLRDIYANNPYTVTTETAFRNLSMFRDSAYLDLKPNLNKWAVMGGLSHSDRENRYKLSSTEVDTKTTGAYAKGEYGLKEDTTLGLILGGTNSKSDLSTGKAKGSSIYLGAYAKKYVNNFKFTLGTGMDFGEYKVDRNAVGYAGIIETSKQSAKQKNRAFDLYAEARYSKDLGNNLYLEPNFNLAYSRVKRGGVTENDGKVNLNIKSKTFKQTTAEIGLDLKKVLLNGNTSHNFVLGASYQRALSGAKDSTARANVVGGGEFDILVPAREKGRTSMGAEYSLENKVGLLFNLKVDYGFNHGSDKKDIRFSTGLGYKF